MQGKTRKRKAVNVTVDENEDIVRMLLRCIETCREGGRRYPRAAYDHNWASAGSRL